MHGRHETGAAPVSLQVLPRRRYAARVGCGVEREEGPRKQEPAPRSGVRFRRNRNGPSGFEDREVKTLLSRQREALLPGGSRNVLQTVKEASTVLVMKRILRR